MILNKFWLCTKHKVSHTIWQFEIVVYKYSILSMTLFMESNTWQHEGTDNFVALILIPRCYLVLWNEESQRTAKSLDTETGQPNSAHKTGNRARKIKWVTHPSSISSLVSNIILIKMCLKYRIIHHFGCAMNHSLFGLKFNLGLFKRTKTWLAVA